MTTISAKVIADSISDNGKRITTMQLRYPRFIHAEFMTHRQFSRNASSSRAVPVSRLIADMQDDPAMPLVWGKNQKGMQADEECSTMVVVPRTISVDDLGTPTQTKNFALSNQDAWLIAMDNAIKMARYFDEAGYHKQIVNRLLEPFSHINVVVTATEWSNFFALRLHRDAEPHMQMLALAMKQAMDKSSPETLARGQWHTPYVHRDNRTKEDDFAAVKLSVARCARVSYLTHDGKEPYPDEDLKLYDRLVGSVPLHASPAEHQAMPDPGGQWPHQWGNFQGWVQYRKTLTGECQ